MGASVEEYINEMQSKVKTFGNHQKYEQMLGKSINGGQNIWGPSRMNMSRCWRVHQWEERQSQNIWGASGVLASVGKFTNGWQNFWEAPGSWRTGWPTSCWKRRSSWRPDDGKMVTKRVRNRSKNVEHCSLSKHVEVLKMCPFLGRACRLQNHPDRCAARFTPFIGGLYLKMEWCTWEIARFSWFCHDFPRFKWFIGPLTEALSVFYFEMMNARMVYVCLKVSICSINKFSMYKVNGGVVWKPAKFSKMIW